MKRLIEGARELGIDLNLKQLGQFETYYRELVEWNRKVNLTRIIDYEEVQIKHFLDSISIAPYIETDRSGLRVIDVGSGAGLPGIPVKIVRPDIKITLLEATAKKAQFLRHLTDTLDLSDVDTVTGRAEEIAHKSKYREKYDLVLSRAVAVLPVLVELVLPFCKRGGMFIAQKKGVIEPEIKQSARVIEEMGGELRDIKTVEIEGIGDERKLVVIDKVKSTPEKYPRRSGMPAKRPIL